MPDGKLVFEDGEVRLNGAALPGILVRQSIAGQVRLDRVEQDGLSGKTKIPMGWEDAGLTLDLELLTDDESDCYDKLAAINRIFKGSDNGSNPRIYAVTGRHARARGIDKVVFGALDSEEDDQADTIRASLAFAEYEPAIVAAEKAIAASNQPKGAAPATTAAAPAPAAKIQDDPTDAFSAGFNAGAG